MTTYVYETIPQQPGEKARLFEFQQSMQDAPLTKHPTTGEPIRRVILGGYGVLKAGGKSAPARAGGSCCGPSCGCHN
jgi:predicted nucleic acid-binding Zn ribbon protein